MMQAGQLYLIVGVCVYVTVCVCILLLCLPLLLKYYTDARKAYFGHCLASFWHTLQASSTKPSSEDIAAMLKIHGIKMFGTKNLPDMQEQDFV